MSEKIENGFGDEDVSASVWVSGYANRESDYQKRMDDLQYRTCALELAVSAAVQMISTTASHPEVEYSKRVEYLALKFENYLRTGQSG